MTNGERIRQMPDKDLAIVIMCPAVYDVEFRKSCGCIGEMDKDCCQCALEWLQQKARE